MIKKCPKCGAEYPEKLLYCVNCGKKLVYEFSEYANYETKESSNKWKWVAAVVAIAAILIGGGAFLFFKMKTPKFAYITNEEVRIFKSPSETASMLMNVYSGYDKKYCWGWLTDNDHSMEYKERGTIVQIISKEDDWYKVCFYPNDGLFDLVSTDGKKYIEGWINSENLKLIEPIQLTWENLHNFIYEWDMIDDPNISQTVFRQESVDVEGINDELVMLYGKIEGNHLNFYGSTDDLMVPIDYEEMNGISIKEKDGHNILYHGYDVAMEDATPYGIDIQKCTPQMREQIFKTISHKPYSRRYYFNIGDGDEEDIRCYEIKYQ